MPNTEATLRGRIASLDRWARTEDRTAATAAGRSVATTALNARLTAEYNLNPSAVDYEYRLGLARSAHFSRLALASAKARRRKPVKK